MPIEQPFLPVEIETSFSSKAKKGASLRPTLFVITT